MNRNRTIAAAVAVFVLALLGYFLIHKDAPKTNQTPPVAVGTPHVSLSPLSTPGDSSTPTPSEATTTTTSPSSSEPTKDTPVHATPFPTPDNVEAIMAPALTYVRTQGSFDHELAYPGYDTKALLNSTHGELHNRVAAQVDPANTSGGDQLSYQQMKKMGMTMSNIITGTPKVVASASQPNTWTVSLHTYLKTTANGTKTDGPDRFVVITVSKVGNAYYAVSDEMPQAP